MPLLVDVVLVTYSKTSTEFRDELSSNPELHEKCYNVLHDAGLPWFSERNWYCGLGFKNSGAKALVRPDQYEVVMKAVAGRKLGYNHVIISAEFVNLVDDALNVIRSKSRPKKRIIEAVVANGRAVLKLDDYLDVFADYQKTYRYLTMSGPVSPEMLDAYLFLHSSDPSADRYSNTQLASTTSRYMQCVKLKEGREGVLKSRQALAWLEADLAS